MKKYAAFAAFAMAALAASAVQTPPGRIAGRDVLMQFLEYRDAGSPALFRASAARLREIADSKIDGDAPPAAKFRRAMAMTLVATYSMDPAARSFAPESLSIDAAARDSYFASARETLDAFAARAKEKKPGEPSWKLYLDALEEGVKAESADSAAEKDRLVKSALAKLEQAAPAPVGVREKPARAPCDGKARREAAGRRRRIPRRRRRRPARREPFRLEPAGQMPGIRNRRP